MDQDGLDAWIARQARFSAAAMLRAISATHLVKTRPGLGQTIRPARGSVLASPETASGASAPDYFFHWLRDSAIVVDALRLPTEDGEAGPAAIEAIGDFVAFSLRLCRLDGPSLVLGGFRGAIDPARRADARPDSELALIVGDRALGEARCNADGTLDSLGWSRPQHDGPALRALTIMRLARLAAFRDRAGARVLLEADLDYTCAHWREAGYDPWEEIFGHHYYTRVVQHAALAGGAQQMAKAGDDARAAACAEAAAAILATLDGFYDENADAYLSCLPGARAGTGALSPPRLDIAAPLAVIHAARDHGPHSLLDPRAFATLRRLERLFAEKFAINRARGAASAPALGRYADDVYFDGGAWHFATLGAAQFYFRLAARLAAGSPLAVTPANRDELAALLGAPAQALGAPRLEARWRKPLIVALRARGDLFFATTRAHTPASGELSEQYDAATGAPTSAANLAWSYAAFLSAAAARREAARLSSSDGAGGSAPWPRR
jgi:glucoamylase